MPGRREVLRVKIYITKGVGMGGKDMEIQSPSSTVHIFSGRPNVRLLVEGEAKDQLGAMAVSSCGPGALGDDVRAAVRRMQPTRNVDFMEEGFGW